MAEDRTQPWTNQLLLQIRRTVSPYAYLSQAEQNQATVGMQIQEVITDHSQGGSTIKFINFDNVAQYERSSGVKQKLSGPTRTQFIRQVRKQYLSIVDSSQKILLPSVYSRLVYVPEVNLSMNPLRKILIILQDQGSVTRDELGRRLSPVEKSGPYFSLLDELGYLQSEDEHYIPGLKMRNLQADEVEPPELYERILGDVIRQRSKYLKEVLHWTMIVPYLRWCNSYYLPSYEAGRSIKLETNDFVDNYKRYYGIRRDYPTEINQIQRIVDAKAISKSEGFYEGQEDIFKEYSREADKEPLLALLRNVS